jgi:tetratricopeptide (TPR) repeat protein
VPRWLPEHKLIEDADAVGDDVVALALLLLLRDLRLWVESPPEERSSLLLPPGRERIQTVERAAEHAQGIAEALHDLSAMRSEPARVTPSMLSAACQRIYRWAERRSLPQVAILFAEAAARVDPRTSRIASDAARAARHGGRLDRAECWYDLGITLAGRDGSRNRGDMISALLGRGTVLREQRRFDEARHVLSRAAKLCASTRRYRIAAETQHDLFALAVMDGCYTEAETHMAIALEHYPLHHPAIPGLVHDWCFLLTQRGFYAQAVPLLENSIPQLRRVEIQLVSWGTLSHAAAGAGLIHVYDEAVCHVLQLATRTQNYAAAALGHAAFGSLFFGDWDAGHALATRAAEIARTRGEIGALYWIEGLLARVNARETPAPQMHPPIGSRITLIGQVLQDFLTARQRPTRRPVHVDVEREASGPLVPARQNQDA